MAKYSIQCICVLEVEAPTLQEACQKANQTPIADWGLLYDTQLAYDENGVPIDS